MPFARKISSRSSLVLTSCLPKCSEITVSSASDRHVTSCDALMGGSMLFSTAGCHAAPLHLSLRSALSAIPPSYTTFRARLFRPLPPAPSIAGGGGGGTGSAYAQMEQNRKKRLHPRRDAGELIKAGNSLNAGNDDASDLYDAPSFDLVLHGSRLNHHGTKNSSAITHLEFRHRISL